MTIRKEDNIVVKPQVSGRVEGRSDYVFYSFDKESAQFIIAFVDANDKPLDLLNANPTVLLIIEEDGKQKKFVLDGTDMKEVSIIDGKVAFIIPDFLLGYRGKVEMYIGVTFADGSSSDELHLAFTMKESPFNAAYEEAKNYYVASFEMLLHEVELAKTTAINDINKQLPEIKKKLSDVESRIEIAEQNIDEVMEKTELHVMYSNSIDFGDYDYSGRANLAPNLDFSKLSGNSIISQPPLAYVKGRDSYFTIDNTDPSAVGTSRNVYVPKLGRLEKGKTYIASVPLLINSDFDTNITNISIHPYNVTVDGVVNRLGIIRPDENCRNKWYRYSIAFTVPSNFPDGDHSPYMQVWEAATATGKISIGYDIKIEKVNSTSDTATPYQPNLLDDPYWVGKTSLG
ncbi:BppU family phage baseplate upper protein, partial [Enterococcus faecium]